MQEDTHECNVLGGDKGELGAYIRDLANEMGLKDWMLWLQDAPPEDPENGAAIRKIYGQHQVFIAIQDDWFKRTPEHIRWLMTHELIHCHFFAITDQYYNLVKDRISPDLQQTLERIWDETCEHAVDDIARAWSETLPLPVLDPDAAPGTPAPSTPVAAQGSVTEDAGEAPPAPAGWPPDGDLILRDMLSNTMRDRDLTLPEQVEAVVQWLQRTGYRKL